MTTLQKRKVEVVSQSQQKALAIDLKDISLFTKNHFFFTFTLKWGQDNVKKLNYVELNFFNICFPWPYLFGFIRWLRQSSEEWFYLRKTTQKRVTIKLLKGKWKLICTFLLAPLGRVKCFTTKWRATTIGNQSSDIQIQNEYKFKH